MNIGKSEHFYTNKHAKEINLRDYYLLIKKRFWIIAVIMVISGTAGFFYSKFTNTLLYQTSTRIIIGSDSEYMKTLMVMIKDPIIMEKVKMELQLDRPPEEIANQIQVTRMEDSQVIKISVMDSDPKLAADLANTTASTFKQEIVQILNFRDVQLLSEAEVNSEPINETRNRTMAIASILGLITGVGFVFLLDSLDSKVRKEYEVEEVLGVPVLGVVSNMNKKQKLANRHKKKELHLRGETIGLK